MSQLGTLSFQSNDNSDVFLASDVLTSELYPTDSELLDYSSDDLSDQPVFITGGMVKQIPVCVDGDSTIVYCTYKAIILTSFQITVYLEYQEVEQLATITGNP